MLTMGLLLWVLFPNMDTGAQLGSHYQLVAWRNYLSCFSYYVPVNTAKNAFLARASQSWFMFGVRSCMGPDLSHLTHRDPCRWLLPPACLQRGREHSFAVWGRAPTCQAQLVAPTCNFFAPASHQQAHLEDWCSCHSPELCHCPVMWVEAPECPGNLVCHEFMWVLEESVSPRSFLIPCLILWSSESSICREDLDGNLFSSQNYQAWQLEKR